MARCAPRHFGSLSRRNQALEAAANRLTHPALDAVAKIAEFKFCAVRMTPGGEPVAPAGCGCGARAG